MKDYVTRNEAGTLRIAGSRVTLASVVHAFWGGETPESIVQSFPTLSLEPVYGAIAYYLQHRDEMDRELRDLDRTWQTLRSAAQQTNRALRALLLAARSKSAT